jgi:signal transduction histidine kinase
MSQIATFIRANSKQIIAEWESFARTLVPAADGMSPLSLRNHIHYILAFIADDIETTQDDAAQIKKSHGEKPKDTMDSVAETHAALRQAGGFNLDQMVSEYRSLRASVTTESISYYSKKADHSRDIFLGVLSHDLRNPIGAMLMSAELATKIGSLSERQTMLMDQVVSSAERATSILNQLLDLTRARLGSGLRIIREQVDMAFITRQLLEEMRSLHPRRTFTLDVSGDTKGEWDRPRVGQVLSNLLGNAVQYGFKDLPIDVAIRGDAKEVSLSVHNQGVPISKDSIRGIFDALIRGGEDGSDVSNSTNLGLGLYITKEIVSAHGGTVQVASTEKDGTTFTARFPRSPGATLAALDDSSLQKEAS